MTDDSASQLDSILRSISGVLLDFDGPVTGLLADGKNMMVADAARQPMHEAGIAMPDEILTTSDHLAVLRFAGGHGDTICRAVEDVCTFHEVEAARTSSPSPGAHDAIHAIRDSGRRIVVVSNNAAEPILTYLDRFQLADLVAGIAGRPHGHPHLMKPHPTLVHQALSALATQPAFAVMVGDSVTDIQVSRDTGIRSIGYAKTPTRGDELSDAGADTLIDHMDQLTSAVKRVCVPPA